MALEELYLALNITEASHFPYLLSVAFPASICSVSCLRVNPREV